MEEIENLIVGAGLSGLMMGYLLKRNYRIIDGALAPKTGVSAPFYLHAPLTWLPTQWKEVDVHHNVWDGEAFHRAPTIRHMNDYSRKITGKIIDTSLKFMDGSVKRGFLPANGGSDQVMSDLYEDVKERIDWGVKVIAIDTQKRQVTAQYDNAGGHEAAVHHYRYKNLISTMPLPFLLALSGQAMPCDFRADPIYTATWGILPHISMDSYQVVYITCPAYKIYRISLMGDSIISESMVDIDTEEENVVWGGNQVEQMISRLWGIRDAEFRSKSIIKPGKFHPITEGQRKGIVNKLTTQCGIYSLGRYATWSYKRIDHISEDAHSILKMIKETK